MTYYTIFRIFVEQKQINIYIMKTLENIQLTKRVNGHGNEIISVRDSEKWNGISKGARIFTTLTSESDEIILERAMFEIDAAKEDRILIAEMVIKLKNKC